MGISTAVNTRPAGARSVVGADTQGLRRVGLVRPTSHPAEILEAHKAIAAMVAEVLEPNIDYGEIPGTDGKKALLKPGAERLAFSIGASIELDVIEQEIDHHVEVEWTKRQKEWYTGAKGKRMFKWVEASGTSRGLYRYVVKARLVRREDGAVLGEGVGACSTMESKYIDRPRETENTVLKMAKKRAAVDAVLSTMALSGRFAPDDADVDEDGAVKDPTDGITLEKSLAWEINKVPLGAMGPKALARTVKWCDDKLQEDPEDATFVRLAAMLELVATFRKENPLAEKTHPSADAESAMAGAPQADED